jgi:four helix bundle protein
MDKTEFQARTKSLAINVAKFCKSLPYDAIVRHYVDQIVRSSASVGANYRAACRSKSKADFINKMRIVEEEADETMYFMELICEFYPNRRADIAVLYKEANEILSMTISSINTVLKAIVK